MAFNVSGNNIYTYADQFATEGIKTWDVNCTNGLGFTNLSVADVLTVGASQPVPEFSTIALLLALVVTFGGFVVMRRRE
jgi:hypothetical protein